MNRWKKARILCFISYCF